MKCPTCGKEMELTLNRQFYWCPDKNCPQKLIPAEVASHA